MIVYEKSITGFIDDCSKGVIADMVASRMAADGIGFGHSEMKSWDKSLPFISDALNQKDIDKNINVAIEYQSQLNKSRIDFLVYGKNEKDADSMVIVELKQWSMMKRTTKPNYVHTVGGGGEGDYQHPSYQSLRYGAMLRGFNEYVQDNHVDINSCSYCHNMDSIYQNFIGDVKTYPFLSQSPVFLEGDKEKLAAFIKKYVKKPSRILLYEIDNAKIRPSKDFSDMLYMALQGKPIFSLDDGQAASVSTIIDETNKAIKENKRKTIIIKGGPGSGKSVVAINAMGQLIHPNDGSDPKNVCYCTVNFTPRTLYSELLVDGDYKKSAIDNLFKTFACFSKSSECDFDCVMFDEAHREFKWKFGQGVKREVDMIDRAFYASRVNVWFIDEDQAVTKDDYLTIDKIKDYAKRYNSEVIEAEDLKLCSQFRCMGGDGYISFINGFLGYEDLPKKKYSPKNYDFRVFDTPSKMWEALQEKQKEHKNARLLSGYTHEWVSKTDESLYDFDMEDGKFRMKWNKFVSYSYINDPDQLDRIGCIHTIQGVDMSYAGVIIGKDLKYRDGQLVFDKSQNAKTDSASGIRNLDNETAKRLIRNTYKVLLTRGMYGTYVYCEDEALNRHLKSLMDVK